MRAVLVTDFPERFVEDMILPELRRRVDVVHVTTRKKAAEINLANLHPDVVLHMIELGGHSSSERLTKACSAAGVPLRALSRKKASWDGILPPPTREKDEQTWPAWAVTPKKNQEETMGTTNGRATIGDLPGARGVLGTAPAAPAAPPKPVPAPVEAAPAKSEAAILDPIVRAIELHANAILALADAVRAAGVPAPAASGPRAVKAAPPNPLVEATDLKILEVLEKLPNLDAEALFLLVTNGAGGEPVRGVSKQNVHDRLRKLTGDGVLDRDGVGGKAEPYRYRLAAPASSVAKAG